MHFGHFIILATSLLYHLAAANETRPWLMPTEYIDSDHPTIVARAESITKDADDQRSKAIYIHDYVRDEVRFGWSSDFYDQKASEVLEEGVGFCNTKSTLMVALLRAAGIPARQRFVDIRSEIIIDFIDPRTDYVDHSFVEVYLDGVWHQIDSYIVDEPLARAARHSLSLEGRVVGYGIHINGTSHWDGRSNAFIQFVNDGVVDKLTSKDHGTYEDIDAFYSSGHGLNELGFFSRLLFGLFSIGANERVEELRTTTESAG